MKTDYKIDVISSVSYRAQYCFGPVNVSNTASYMNDIDDNTYNHLFICSTMTVLYKLYGVIKFGLGWLQISAGRS